MKIRTVIAVCAIVSGCSNPFSKEKGPELPDVWFITKDGITVMSEYPDEMLSRLNIDTDSLGTILDIWNAKTQKVLEEFIGYDPQYLSSPDLNIVWASQDYVAKWVDGEKVVGLYVQRKKAIFVTVWWDLGELGELFDLYKEYWKEPVLLSQLILVHELTHYYQHKAGRKPSECDARAATQYYFLDRIIYPIDSPDCGD